MRFHNRYVVLTAVLLACVCVVSCNDDISAPEITEDILLKEAVLRFEMDKWRMDWYAFVTFSERETPIPMSPRSAGGPLHDIDLRLYNLLLDGELPVRPIAECEPMNTTHPDFEGYGYCVWYSHITYTSDSTAVVYAGYHCDPMSSAGDLLLLERDSAGWHVLNCRQLWIS